jgi:hypothetical protein
MSEGKSGSAMKAAENRVKASRDRQKQLAALRREWIGDSELTRGELTAKLASLREDFYSRHPEFAR